MYKLGRENGLANALSRVSAIVESPEPTFASLVSKIGDDFVQQIRAENQSEPFFARIQQESEKGKEGFLFEEGVVKFRGRTCINPTSPLI